MKYWRDENLNLYAIIEETKTHYICEGLKGAVIGLILKVKK